MTNPQFNFQFISTLIIMFCVVYLTTYLTLTLSRIETLLKKLAGEEKNVTVTERDPIK